jgi:sulfatase maturation enzyme AslB (radical SAM superfamily)
MSYIKYNLHLDLHATDVCKLGCPWCAYDAGRSTYVVPLERVKAVFEEAGSHGIREVHIYGGEVLHLDLDYVKALLGLARAHFDHVGLLTKGHPLDRFIVALQYVDSVFISLHPTTPSTYAAVEAAARASVRARTSVVADRIVVERDPMEFVARAYESGADNIAFMYMSPVSEFLDPSTWRRSLQLWVTPDEWIRFVWKLKERVPEDLQGFVRVQPSYSKAPRGCEVWEYTRRVVYYKGRYYLCHMAIAPGLGAGTITDALETQNLYERYECVGYVAVARGTAGVAKDYRLVAGTPPGYAPECPMRTLKLKNLDPRLF